MPEPVAASDTWVRIDADDPAYPAEGYFRSSRLTITVDVLHADDDADLLAAELLIVVQRELRRRGIDGDSWNSYAEGLPLALPAEVAAALAG